LRLGDGAHALDDAGDEVLDVAEVAIELAESLAAQGFDGNRAAQPTRTVGASTVSASRSLQTL
jgi:hypothetical protein